MKHLLPSYSDERGRFTVEATLLFPFIFIIVLTLIFGSLYVYQKTVLYYTASTIAERTAYVWDNSHKNHRTGAFNVQQYDDLYWRISGDSVSDIFSFIKRNEATTFQLPEQLAQPSLRGPAVKLKNGAEQLVDGLQGELSYRNRFVDRRVQVTLSSGLQLPSFTHPFLPHEVQAESSATIVDPVEFIRTVTLVDQYARKLGEKMVTKQKTNKALNEFLGNDSPATFATHQEALAYLQSFVQGKERHLDTSHGKRMIDAFDQYSISHQAFLTFNTTNLRLQLAKDAELLADGSVVKGVVWHFFRRTNQTGTVGPSEQLRREIESKGIVVVIHD